jgi:hypothetical protein
LNRKSNLKRRNTMHPIIAALGVEIPPDKESEVLAKIVRDNLVSLRAQELVTTAYGDVAIRQMHPREKAALLTRLGLGEKKPSAREITWHVAIPAVPGTPVALVGRLIGEADDEGKRQIIEEVRYQGTPENAHRVTWKNSRPPADVVAEYETQHKPVAAMGAEYYKAAATGRKPEPPTIGLPGADFVR